MKNKILCPRDGCKNEAIVDTTFGVMPCQVHQDEDAQTSPTPAPEFYNISKQHRIQAQRDKYSKDILQPYLPGKEMKPNPDFVKAYPGMAKEYFTGEQLGKM